MLYQLRDLNQRSGMGIPGIDMRGMGVFLQLYASVTLCLNLERLPSIRELGVFSPSGKKD